MRRLAVALLAGILAFPTSTVFAGNKGGAGKSWGAQSSGHASVEGMRNTKGQWSPDRDQGLDRALERRSDSELEHSNALEPHSGRGDGAGKSKWNEVKRETSPRFAWLLP
jgi:hypothetical protein